MHYHDFGIFLLDDNVGARVTTLAAPHQRNSEPILKATLMKEKYSLLHGQLIRELCGLTHSLNNNYSSRSALS